MYRTTDVIPLLTRIWAMPDDLPHAAGGGNLERVKQWFDESGAQALGDLQHPRTSRPLREHDDLRWGAPAVQHVLDTALAFASSTATSTWLTSFSGTSPTSTPIGTRTSRRASSITWSSCRARTSRCGSSSTAAS